MELFKYENGLDEKEVEKRFISYVKELMKDNTETVGIKVKLMTTDPFTLGINMLLERFESINGSGNYILVDYEVLQNKSMVKKGFTDGTFTAGPVIMNADDMYEIETLVNTLVSRIMVIESCAKLFNSTLSGDLEIINENDDYKLVEVSRPDIRQIKYNNYNELSDIIYYMCIDTTKDYEKMTFRFNAGKSPVIYLYIKPIYEDMYNQSLYLISHYIISQYNKKILPMILPDNMKTITMADVKDTRSIIDMYLNNILSSIKVLDDEIIKVDFVGNYKEKEME